jgi:glutamate 5-kinase
LADNNRNVRSKWIASVTEDIAELAKMGKNVVIVSSGAVALGRKVISKNRIKLKIEEKQAAAAIGQPLLMTEYRRAFAKFKYKCAEILITISDIENRRRYLNAKNTIEKLIEYNVIPIVNENDTVATNELRFGDNDRISALVAQMIHADLLIILSDVDGLYTDDPSKNPKAEFIPIVTDIEAVRKNAKGPSSNVGSGGMITKIDAAEIADNSGCSTVITKGSMLHPLKNLFDGGKHTFFKSEDDPISARKKWILNAPISHGVVIVDDGCEKALINKKSLLAVGITKTIGEYGRGDIIVVRNQNGDDIAHGITAFSSLDIERVKGKKSSEVEIILGFSGRDSVIHIDNLALLN